MFLRRFFLWALPICFCLFFGESFLLMAAGVSAKLYFRMQKGWDLSFASLAWKDKTLVFSDFSLQDASSFSLQSARVVVSLSNKHIDIEQPDIFLKKAPPLDSSNFWTFAIKKGTLHIGEALIFLETRRDLGAQVLDISCNEFPLSYLNSWTPSEWEGFIRGGFRLANRGDIWTLLEGSIEGFDIGYQGILQGISGKATWHCAWDEKDPFSAEVPWGWMMEEGRLRLDIAEGRIFGSRQQEMLSHLQGSLSYDGKAGAKWEISFDHLGKKMEETGRGFFHSLQGRWIESELRSGESSLFVQCHEQKEGYLWDVKAKSLHADMVGWLQDFSKLFQDSSFDGAMEEGVIDVAVQWYLDKTGRVDWHVFEGFLENVRWRNGSDWVACKEARVKDHTYFFREGSFFWKDQISGAAWQGEGDLSKGLGAISGKVGDLFLSAHLQGSLDAMRAEVVSEGAFQGTFNLQTKWEGSDFSFQVNRGNGAFFSLLQMEDFQMQGEMGKKGFSCFDARGAFAFCAKENRGKKVSFYCPIFQLDGPFDFRLEHPLFDLARIVGNFQGEEFAIDGTRSHIFGKNISHIQGTVSENTLHQLHMDGLIPWRFFSFFFELPPFFSTIGEEDCLQCQCVYEKEKGIVLDLLSQFSLSGMARDLQMHLVHRDGMWRLDSSSIFGCLLEGNFQWGKEGIQILDGRGKWKEDITAHFNGRVISLDQWNLNLSCLRADLRSMPWASDWKIEGVLEGGGILHWEGGLESDFDLVASHVKVSDQAVENEGPLHVYYSSKKGLCVRGLNLSMMESEATSSANWKIGLFQYDSPQDLFVFTQLQFYVPSGFSFGKEKGLLLPFKIPHGLQGVADCAFSADFSNVSLSMKEIEIPWDDSKYHVQNLHFDMDRRDCKMNFDLDHQSRFIPIDLTFHLDPFPSGRLMIENGLKVDWSYRDRLVLQAIEGTCSGIDASFQREGDFLIGSARLNCNELKEVLPQKIARVFHELKIGNGYELMGRLFFADQGLGFKGILRGKQIELFNFELKNILAKIEWDANHLLISDLKVSDFAGVLKVDQICAQGIGDAPWTISIPHIAITELRPSLLQDVGGAPGKLSPLVVRELHLNNFQGLVDDGKTYTAQGELYFINSYKREKSILEIPSDLLSRIVGLDLDLLIPVCGTLRYELRDGFFHFTELEKSFSENQRSEFFLVFNEDSPKMDLDWNLSILIQMKQFVLFKFTEAFIISVKGKLDDPKFQLQRKKRFLGVL